MLSNYNLNLTQPLAFHDSTQRLKLHQQQRPGGEGSGQNSAKCNPLPRTWGGGAGGRDSTGGGGGGEPGVAPPLAVTSIQTSAVYGLRPTQEAARREGELRDIIAKMSREMAHKVIVPKNKNCVLNFLKQWYIRKFMSFCNHMGPQLDNPLKGNRGQGHIKCIKKHSKYCS